MLFRLLLQTICSFTSETVSHHSPCLSTARHTSTKILRILLIVLRTSLDREHFSFHNRALLRFFRKHLSLRYSSFRRSLSLAVLCGGWICSWCFKFLFALNTAIMYGLTRFLFDFEFSVRICTTDNPWCRGDIFFKYSPLNGWFKVHFLPSSLFLLASFLCLGATRER